MRILYILLLLTPITQAAIYDIYTSKVTGRLVIQPGDTIIVSPKNPLTTALRPAYIKLVVCETQSCRDNYKSHMQHLYRTNGITIHTIK